MIWTLLVIICILSINWAAKGSCNITKLSEWEQEKYTGKLASDPSFWMYQTQTFFVLRNELAIKLAVAGCKDNMKSLFYFLAGKEGPIDEQTAWKQMCSSVCLESDRLHEEAISYTGCSCLELSTQPRSSSYSVEGDFCVENTARMLCELVGFCGVWDCRIDDFMCPRYEYNKKKIPFKGYGNCQRSAAFSIRSLSMFWSCLITVALLVLWH